MRGDWRGAATLDALRAGVLLWCAELLLARISDVPQWPRDLVLTGLVYVPGTLALAGLARLVPWPASFRDAAVAGCVALPAASLSAAVPVLRLRNEDPVLALGLAGVLFFGVLAAAMATARARRSPELLPAVVVGAVAAAAAATWAVTASPPVTVALVLAGAWGLLLLLSRRPLGWVAAALAVALVSLAPFELRAHFPTPAHGGPVPSGPDIVLVVVDTLRADDARAMQSYRELAARGVAYEQVQASSCWTLPSMASLMTGSSVARHGAGRIPGPGPRRTTPISDGLPTLAERLSAAGYDTAAILAMNPFLNPRYGFARGFDYFDLGGGTHHRGALPASSDFVSRPVLVQLLISAAYRVQSPALHRLIALPERQGSDRSLAHARSWLRQRSERPYFLWVHAMEPHLPYAHAAEMDLPDEQRALLLNANRPRILADPHWRLRPWRDLLHAAYRAEIRVLDGFLLDFLAGLGPPRDRGRVVVLVSDHGEEFFDNGGFEHGHALYQAVVSVPLVLAGVDPERLRDPGSVVAQMDVAPTLLELAGLEPGDTVEGTSLLRPRRFAAIPTQNLLYSHAVGRAVRLGDWKLIDVDGREELYDLAGDPHEQKDLSGRHPEAKRLRLLLPESGVRGEEIAPTAAEREALEALGYLE